MKNGIRKQREFDRLLLKHAKEQFINEFGEEHIKKRGIIDQFKVALFLKNPKNYPGSKFGDQVLKKQAAEML